MEHGGGEEVCTNLANMPRMVTKLMLLPGAACLACSLSAARVLPPEQIALIAVSMPVLVLGFALHSWLAAWKLDLRL